MTVQDRSDCFHFGIGSKPLQALYTWEKCALVCGPGTTVAKIKTTLCLVAQLSVHRRWVIQCLRTVMKLEDVQRRVHGQCEIRHRGIDWLRMASCHRWASIPAVRLWSARAAAGASTLHGHRARSLTALAIVFFVIFDIGVHALHVITQVPFPGESIGRLGPLAAREFTKERIVTMVVQAVSLALVSEQAGIG